MRYIEVPIAYDAACTIAVTPIVDFGLPQETTTKQYPSPSARTQVIISAPFAKSGTTVRAAVQVTSRAGAVQVNTPRVVYQPKAVATTGPVGGTA